MARKIKDIFIFNFYCIILTNRLINARPRHLFESINGAAAVMRSSHMKRAVKFKQKGQLTCLLLFLNKQSTIYILYICM